MMMNFRGREGHRTANIIDLQPHAGEVFRRRAFGQHARRTLRHHLRHELMRVEHRARNCGKQNAGACTSRIMTDVGDDGCLVTRQLRLRYRTELSGGYWALIHRITLPPPPEYFDRELID